MDKQQWAAQLKMFIMAKREALPIPMRSTLTAEQEAECQIIGAEFLDWNRDESQSIIGQRQALRIIPFDQEPLIICTTSIPGLVALHEIVPEPPDFMFSLLTSEFYSWNRQVVGGVSVETDDDSERGENDDMADAEPYDWASKEFDDTVSEEVVGTSGSEVNDTVHLLDATCDEFSDISDYDEPELMFSAHHWSYFRDISKDYYILAIRDFPQVAVDEFRLRMVGDLWGSLCGSESGNLWR